MSNVRWGIVGCGDVCEVKSGPGFQKADGSELVAVMRRDAAKAEDYARRHGVPRWYADARQLIDDPGVDAVYIATDVGTHMHYALQVAAAGKPCYVEKPMARSHEECLRMVEAFDKARLPLFVAYYRRCLPRFVKARQLIDSGALGTVTSVGCRFLAPRHAHTDPGNLEWRLVAENSGGGLFMDLGSHGLDILDFLLGPIADVSGLAANLASPYDVEDGLAICFRHERGTLGSAAWNFASAIGEDIIEISGTAGRISMSLFGNEPVRLQTPAGEQQFDLPNPPHVQQPLIQSIVDQLQARGQCPSTGVSGMNAAMRSAYTGRRAEQVMNGVTKIVASRSRSSSTVRAARMAGTAQA